MAAYPPNNNHNKWSNKILHQDRAATHFQQTITVQVQLTSNLFAGEPKKVTRQGVWIRFLSRLPLAGSFFYLLYECKVGDFLVHKLLWSFNPGFEHLISSQGFIHQATALVSLSLIMITVYFTMATSGPLYKTYINIKSKQTFDIIWCKQTG